MNEILINPSILRSFVKCSRQITRVLEIIIVVQPKIIDILFLFYIPIESHGITTISYSREWQFVSNQVW